MTDQAEQPAEAIDPNYSNYMFDAGYAELVIFEDKDGGVSITLQSKARGYDDYHNQQCMGSLTAEERLKVARRLAPPAMTASPDAIDPMVDELMQVACNYGHLLAKGQPAMDERDALDQISTQLTRRLAPPADPSRAEIEAAVGKYGVACYRTGRAVDECQKLFSLIDRLIRAHQVPAAEGMVTIPISLLNPVAYVIRTRDPERQTELDREYDAALDGIRAIIVAHESAQVAAVGEQR